MTPKVLWEVVKEAARRAEIPKLAPHDLRRTCPPGFATLPAANWIKFNSYSDTCRSKPQSIILGVSTSCVKP